MTIPVSMQFGSRINNISNGQSRNWVLLWKNPAPADSFAGQTIQLDLQTFDAVFVAGGSDKNFWGSVIVPKGYTGAIRFPLQSGSNVRWRTRDVTCTDTGVIFGDATYNTQGSSTTTTQNTGAIPLFIYGIKFG